MRFTNVRSLATAQLKLSLHGHYGTYVCTSVPVEPAMRHCSRRRLHDMQNGHELISNLTCLVYSVYTTVVLLIAVCGLYPPA